ncbi:MAG: adenosylcobinamide-phosphate synthase CbiB [Stenomitos frigidus ULC029]
MFSGSDARLSISTFYAFTHVSSIATLVFAAALDYLIGDPKSWWHPVQGIGWMIAYFTRLAFSVFHTSFALRCAGLVLGSSCIVGSGLVGWLAVAIAHHLHPLLGTVVATILLASCFAARSLRDAVSDVLETLAAGDLVNARLRLSQYVGRDTDRLTAPEILRAMFETVTENATDGVLAPLFYALVGAMLPGIGSVPLALAYKAASTLDSMVGYRDAPYTDLGWFSAKTEDVLTWIPCRLTVLTIALLSRRPLHVWRLCLRDAPQDPSPNSGWSECAYAAALDVQVGGINWYQGIAKPKPLLGVAVQPITADTLDRALQLTRWSVLLWLTVFAIALQLWRVVRFEF